MDNDFDPWDLDQDDGGEHFTVPGSYVDFEDGETVVGVFGQATAHDPDFEDMDAQDIYDAIMEGELMDDDDEYQPAYDDDDDDEDDDDDGEDEDDEPMYIIQDDEDDEEEDDPNQNVRTNALLELLAMVNGETGGLTAEARMSLLNRLLQGNGGTIFQSRPPRRQPEPANQRWYEPQVEPDPRGLALLRSGDFGPAGPWKPSGKHRPRPSERYGWRRLARARSTLLPLTEPMLPNNPGTVVAEYPDVRAYVGQYCRPDNSVFYCATQDFKIYMYSTTEAKEQAHTGHPAGDSEDGVNRGYPWLRHRMWRPETSMKEIKAVQGIHGQWTITDADADRTGERMIYSSITSKVHMLHTSEHDMEHTLLDFSDRPYGRFGIWSIRFSADGKEVVAGASSGQIMVYDIDAQRRTLQVPGHHDDVNAVCFADESSTNILVSGSDDGYIKVWDRRSLSSSTPSGVLVGATEGITYMAPKGDGRYIVANSKDQAARLYDLRKMRNWSEFVSEPDAVARWGQPRFDYRNMRYRPPKHLAHPRDCSVMTYRGHAVLKTLIRCHFSPAESTGQSYIYSGSADGRIHIWSLDGRVVQVLNRAESVPLRKQHGSGYNDPSAPEPACRPTHRQPERDEWDYVGLSWTVRDVAWHAFEPTLMSTCFDAPGDRGGGSVAKHEWKGLGKGGLRSLEDWVEKTSLESSR